MEAVIKVLIEIAGFTKEWGALIIAGISLLIAIISLFKSSNAQRLQNKVNELELKIKENELERIAKEKESEELACVEARFITIGKGKHRLKVWNSGNATAYNVSARFDGNVGIMIIDQEKQPFEELEARKSYELIFTLGLHLLLHGATYRLGRCNILQLNAVDLYSPLVSSLVQHYA